MSVPTRARSLCIALSATLLAAALVAAPGAAAPGAGGAPEAYPLRKVHRGLRATALTTFGGPKLTRVGIRVLGVDRDALAPGSHLILVKMTRKSRRTTPGFFAGMSGSPVYVGDRLLGSLSYGVCCGEGRFIGGLTPGKDLLEVLTFPAKPPVDPVLRVRSRLLARYTGFRTLAPIATPLVVSGLRPSRLDALDSRLEQRGLRVLTVPAGRGSGADARLAPGLPYGVALSHGDFTAAAVGTMTLRSGDKTVAFGHPFTFLGPVRMGLTSATSMGVVPDDVLVPFVIAEIGDLVGVVTQDRLEGVLGLVGTRMPATELETRLTNEDLDRTVRARSLLAQRFPFLPDIALFGSLVSFDGAFNKIGPGSAELAWTITGTRAGGVPFTFTRSDIFDSAFDVSFEAIFGVAAPLFAIHSNVFERVRIDSVEVTGSFSSARRVLTLEEVSVTTESSPEPVTSGTVFAAPGETVTVTAILRERFADPRTVTMTVTAPDAEGSYSLVVKGGAGGFFEGPSDTGSSSFDELLAALAEQPRNRDLTVQIRWFTPEGDEETLVTATEPQEGAVSGEKVFELFVGSPEPPPEEQP